MVVLPGQLELPHTRMARVSNVFVWTAGACFPGSLVAVLCMALGGSGCGLLGSSGLTYSSHPMMTADGTIVLSIATRAGDVIVELAESETKGTALARGTFPAPGPNGRLAFVRSATEGAPRALWLRQPNGSEAALTDDRYEHAWPVWVTGGSRIAFLRARTLRSTSTFGKRWVDWDVYTVGADGTDERRVTSESYWGVEGMSLGYDESTILLGADTREDEPRIYEIGVASDRIDRFGEDGDLYPGGAIGRKMFFLRHVGAGEGGFCYELFSRERTGAAEQLTDVCSYLSSPSVTPQGDRVLMLSDMDRDGRFQLMSFDVGSRSLSQIELPEGK